MADQVEQVEQVGFGANLMESIKGVAIGALLFLASFWVLWWNEGRVDLSEVAKKSVEVKADSVDKGAEGKLVAVTGDLKTDDKLEDPQFLKPVNLRLEREVEDVRLGRAPQQRDQQEGRRQQGSEDHGHLRKEVDVGSQPPTKFIEPKDHENPSMALERRVVAAEHANVGAYPFNATEASLPSGDQINSTTTC